MGKSILYWPHIGISKFGFVLENGADPGEAPALDAFIL